MNNRGVTLIELMVAVSIIGIIIVALAFSYQGWQGRYKVEGAAKTLYTDLMDAKAQATQRATTFLADFTTKSYQVGSDTNGNGVLESTEVLSTFPKSVAPYTISGGVLITFDSKGLIYFGNPPVLIDQANPLTISLTANPAIDADFDCVRIGPTMINPGKMTAPPPGGVCNAK